MKKTNLSFMTLFMLTTALVGGCSCGKQSNENINTNVFEIDGKKYSADELMKQLLSTSTGENEAFAKILRVVVENSMDTLPNIQAAADLAAKSFEEEVETYALQNGVSVEDARKSLLEEKGYESVDDMKADIIYEQKLTRITESYWEENKNKYYDEYIEARLPYLIRHVLVKVQASANGNKIANNVAISQDEAKKLFDVIKDLEKEGDFDTVARLESDDPGSNMTGGAYYMDNSYGTGSSAFVDEFLYGTYAFDTYTKRSVEDGKVKYTYGADQDKLEKLVGLKDTETFAKYYESGFNFVDMSIVNMLGEVYNKTTQSNKNYFTISVVDKDGKDASNLNSSENYYARSIIFNRAFNKPGVSVIGYNTKEEAVKAGAKHYVEYKVDNTTKYILADENDNAIFFVAARGSSNQVWIHFLTINVSALDDLENAKKFFTLNPKTDDDYVTYVELMSKEESTQETNKYISELEGYVKSYATAGSGASVGNASLLQYDMVNHYMSANNIEFMNEDLKKAINSFVENKRKYDQLLLNNAIATDWGTHTNKLASNMSSFVQQGVKPFECAVLVDEKTETRDNPYTALNTSDNLCRYVYGKGYEVQLHFFYETTSAGSSSESFTRVTKNADNRISFSETDYNNIQYVTVGGTNSNHIVLPTPNVKAGFLFEGWYLDKDLTQPVTSIDLSESRMTNQTIFFAKVVSSATTINYVYKYKDTNITVSDEAVSKINNSNVKSKSYSASNESDNIINISLSKITSSDFTIDSITGGRLDSDNKIVLVESDETKTIDIVVYVEPKATTVEFVYVDSEGNEIYDQSDVSVNIATSYTYNPENPAESNKITLTAGSFESTDYQITGEYKFTDSNKDFEEAISLENGEFTIAEKHIGGTVKIYVIVENIAGGQE